MRPAAAQTDHMEYHDIPDDVRRFILGGVPSVPCLEALLLLRAEPHQDWDAPAVARRVYIADAQAREILAYLIGIGVAAAGARADSVRYRPAHDDLRATLDRVAAAYAAHLVTVTNLIHAKGSKKAQHFANAFKWRKDR